ncbi:MAG TPA: cysteine dioxygenase family protein [Thermoanaerobaculia bacterium]|nr:cysteine dioxygenase family protein [Thermoanaerobaculia bacterium]
MKTATLRHVDTLIARLSDAVRLGDPEAITHRIKDELEEFAAGGVEVPQRFRGTRPDSYCRRLLHRDAELDWSAVVMTWGPGQHTALHDHAGIWCVEGVIEGEMEVTRFELMEKEDDLCRFEERGHAYAGVGSAGALIPPYEYHVLGNAHPDRVALTLHVYGGEMDHCGIFEPLGGGRFRRRQHALAYDA